MVQPEWKGNNRGIIACQGWKVEVWYLKMDCDGRKKKGCMVVGSEEGSRSTLDGIRGMSGVMVAIWLLALNENGLLDVLATRTLILVRYGRLICCVMGWPLDRWSSVLPSRLEMMVYFGRVLVFWNEDGMGGG